MAATRAGRPRLASTSPEAAREVADVGSLEDEMRDAKNNTGNQDHQIESIVGNVPASARILRIRQLDSSADAAFDRLACFELLGLVCHVRGEVDASRMPK